jgi:hypothetical protein
MDGGPWPDELELELGIVLMTSSSSVAQTLSAARVVLGLVARRRLPNHAVIMGERFSWEREDSVPFVADKRWGC